MIWTQVVPFMPPTRTWKIMIAPTTTITTLPCWTGFPTSGCRHRNGMATGSTSGATRSVTCRRSPKRAFSSMR